MLVLCDGLDAERFLRLLESGAFAALRGGSAAGLMNPAVRGPKTTASAYLTLGAGERCAAGDSSQPVVLVSAPFEGGTAVEAYERRIGSAPPGAVALHLGWARILADAAAEVRGGVPGALADSLRRGGVQTVYSGRQSPVGRLIGAATLAGCDGYGSLRAVRPPDAPLPRILLPELVVIDLVTPDRAAPEEEALAAAQALAAQLDPARDLLVMVAPTPGAPQGSRIWSLDRLCPVLIWGRNWAGRTLSSSTTRTPGLVANIDVAPTLLAHFRIPPAGAMGGHVMSARPGQDLPGLRAYAHQARVNRRGFVPVLVLWGAYAGLSAALGVLALLPLGPARRWPWLPGLARVALTLVTTVPLAMLAAGSFTFFSAHNLLYFLAAAALALGILCSLIARWIPLPGDRGRAPGSESLPSPVLIAYILTTAAILADTFAGGHRLAISVLSDFPVTGMRFYGLGNEYAGVLIGISISIVPWTYQLLRCDRLPRAGWVAAAMLWSAVVITLGWPALGADFGGALAAWVGALATARFCAGGRLGPRDLVKGAALTILLAGVLFFIDALRPAEVRTHVGELARGAGGGSRLLAVVEEKVRMNLRLMTAAPFLISLAGVAPVLLLWYHGAGARSMAALQRRPLLRAGIYGTLVGAVGALVFNDSGVVAWGIATAGALTVWLDVLLAERVDELRGAPAP